MVHDFKTTTNPFSKLDSLEENPQLSNPLYYQQLYNHQMPLCSKHNSQEPSHFSTFVHLNLPAQRHHLPFGPAAARDMCLQSCRKSHRVRLSVSACVHVCCPSVSEQHSSPVSQRGMYLKLLHGLPH